MKRFYSSLTKHATNLTNFEKEKMLPLTKRANIIQQDATACYIFSKEFTKYKNYRQVRDHCHFTGIGAAHSICNLRFNVPKEIPVVFHNGSSYDYHFIIKVLANKFVGQFKYLGENTTKIKIIETILMKNSKSDLRTHLSFLIMMLINLFCY